MAVLGVVTQVSFRYWKGEALAASEQQALLAGYSTRTLVQTALLQGRTEQAHRSLRRLVEDAPITAARVWSADVGYDCGTIFQVHCVPPPASRQGASRS